MTLTCDRHRAGRIERDNYPTPAWCTRRILERLGSRLRGGLHMGEPYARWIEPCAGEGAIVRELHARREELGIAWLDACDVRTETRAALLAAGVQSVRVGSDACMWLTAGAPWRVAITNPPFSDAERIAKAMRAAAHHVVLLTRLNWLASARALERRGCAPICPTSMCCPSGPISSRRSSAKAASLVGGSACSPLAIRARARVLDAAAP